MKQPTKLVLGSIIVFIFLAQLVPFLFTTPEGYSYQGIPFNVVDNNNYFSFMQQAKEGHILFTNKYTSESVPYIFANPVFLVMGWFTLLFPPLIVHYIFKFAFLVLFAWLLYSLIKKVVDKKYHNLALVLSFFGSGIGYVFVALHKAGFKLYGSADQWLMASHALGLSIAPMHFIASVCLMIASVLLYVSFWNTKKSSYLMWCAAALVVLGFIHLYDVITLMAAFGLFLLYQLLKKKTTLKEIIIRHLGFGLLVAIPFVYIYYLFALDPFFSVQHVQNYLLSPPIHHTLFGFLVPLALALVYLIVAFRRKKPLSDLELVLGGWMIASLLLMYSPFTIQRRFIEGLHVPIMILATLGIVHVVIPLIKKYVANKSRKIAQGFIVTLIILISIPNSLLILYQTNSSVAVDVELDDFTMPYYLHVDEVEAMEWLRNSTGNEEVIMTTYATGNYISGIANNRVFIGHWAQTLHLEDKRRIAQDFYTTQTIEEQQNTIQQHNIDYIYYGPREKELGSFNSNAYPVVFQNENVIISKAS